MRDAQTDNSKIFAVEKRPDRGCNTYPVLFYVHWRSLNEREAGTAERERRNISASLHCIRTCIPLLPSLFHSAEDGDSIWSKFPKYNHIDYIYFGFSPQLPTQSRLTRTI